MSSYKSNNEDLIANSKYNKKNISKKKTSHYEYQSDDFRYADTDSVHVTGWQKLPDHLLALTVREFQEVMDDGLVNGFEFRLQGSTIIFREVQH